MKKMEQLDPLVLVGVAAYVGVVYTFWGAFRAYFDWSESLALSFIVRRIASYYGSLRVYDTNPAGCFTFGIGSWFVGQGAKSACSNCFELEGLC